MIDSPDLDILPSRPPGCPSRFRLERYLAGELESRERGLLTGHLDACPACQAVRAAIEEGRRAFQARVPFEDFLADLETRLAQTAEAPSSVVAAARLEAHPAQTADGPSSVVAQDPGPGWFARFLAGLAEALRLLSRPPVMGLAAAALALFVLVPRLQHLWTEPGGGTGRDPLTGLPDREKGVREPGPLDVIVLRGGQVLTGVSGSVFYEGDRLQFTVHPGSRRYLQLFSVEAGGRVSPFYPDGSEESIHLGPDADQPLSGSIRLDSYVGLERIFALFSDAPIDGAVIEAAVTRLARQEGLPLALDRLTTLPIPGTSQVSFLMVKE